MIINSVQKLAKDIGKDIGRSDNKIQADLLNGFAEGFYTPKMDSHAEGLQMAYIADELSDEAKKFITEFSEYTKELEK